MWLHVGCICAKKLLDAVNGQLFGNVNKLATAVVALAGVAFSVFIGEL